MADNTKAVVDESDGKETQSDTVDPADTTTGTSGSASQPTSEPESTPVETDGSAEEEPSEPSTGTDTPSSPLPSTGDVYNPNDYFVSIVPEILSSKAFKDAGFLPPRERYNYNSNDSEIKTDDPNYMWVLYNPHPDEHLVDIWLKYGVFPFKIKQWNPTLDPFDYVGHTILMRVLVSKLPHD